MTTRSRITLERLILHKVKPAQTLTKMTNLDPLVYFKKN